MISNILIKGIDWYDNGKYTIIIIFSLWKPNLHEVMHWPLDDKYNTF